MQITFNGPELRRLYELAEEIATLARNDVRYEYVYSHLADALDTADNWQLINYIEESEA